MTGPRLRKLGEEKAGAPQPLASDSQAASPALEERRPQTAARILARFPSVSTPLEKTKLPGSGSFLLPVAGRGLESVKERLPNSRRMTI